LIAPNSARRTNSMNLILVGLSLLIYVPILHTFSTAVCFICWRESKRDGSVLFNQSISFCNLK
jgi:hypothetical protein